MINTKKKIQGITLEGYDLASISQPAGVWAFPVLRLRNGTDDRIRRMTLKLIIS